MGKSKLERARGTGPAGTAQGVVDDRRVRGLVLLVLAIFAGTELADLVSTMRSARQQALDAAHQTARNLTLALEQHTAGTLDAVELGLKALDHRLTMALPVAGPESFDAQMEDALANLPFVRAIWVLDAEGDMIRDSDHLAGKHNLADRAYFQVPRDDAARSQRLYIDVPTLSRHGLWFIPVSRRVEHADGRFAGVIVAALEPRALEAFYGSLEVGADGVVALLRTDGVIMHRSPSLRDPEGPVRRVGHEFVQRLARAPHGSFNAVDPLDGRTRLHAYRQVPGRPLVVTVALGRDESLAPWRDAVRLHGMGSLVMLLLVAGLGYWLLRELRQRRIQQTRIDRLHRVQAVLSGINSLIARARHRDELFEESCRIAVNQGGFGVAWIDAYDEATDRIRPCASAGPDAARLVPGDRSPQPPAESQGELVAQAIAGRRTVFSNDLAALPGPRSALRTRALEHGYQSAVALPLFSHGEVVAVMAMLAKERLVFDGDELALLDELSGDVSFALEHIAAQEQINYMALYDVLTGLPNRTLVAERLGQFLQQPPAQSKPCGLAEVDIQRFRSINDTLGWAGGDALLREVASRLRAALGEHALLGRLERDRFVFVVGCLGDAIELAAEARRVVRQVFDPPFRAGDRDLRLAPRVGVAVFPGDGADPATLLRNAETALARSKDSPERFLFYAPVMNARVAESVALENRLRNALEADEFELHYQPKVATGTGALVGLEALLRWRDPQEGLVQPVQFIPVLEETGLIRDVGKWTLQQVMRDRARWRGSGLDAPRVAVNVSALQLHEAAFLAVVREVVRGVPGGDHGLDIELTESAVMTHVESNAEQLAALRELGLCIAIDDFGTGYSSLQYIARLPLDALKIDREFVAGMIDGPTDRAIVASVISLAHQLGLVVVAEGVETVAQAEALQALACDQMQGFLFSPPVPAGQVDAWLDRGARFWPRTA